MGVQFPNIGSLWTRNLLRLVIHLNLLLKMTTRWPPPLQSESRRWNDFDVVVVAICWSLISVESSQFTNLPFTQIFQHLHRDKILIVTSYCMDWFWYAVNNITTWNQMTSIFRSEYYLYILDICILHVLFCTIIWDGKWCVRRLSHSILKMEMQCNILINLYHLSKYS